MRSETGEFPVTQTEVESEFDDIEVDAPLVGIVMGSKSDMPEMEKAARELEERGIHHEIRVMSAHRDPDVVADYATNAAMSWSVTRSRSRTASAVKEARSRIAAASSLGTTPCSASASTTASSTCSHVSSLCCSDQIPPSSGRV